MERKSVSSVFKNKVSNLKALGLFLGVILSSPLFSQELFWQKSVTFNDSITAVSSDAEGNVYVATSKGTLSKYSLEGDSLLTYSPRKNGMVSLMEAWWGLRVFLFYEDFQEYLLLDQFFRPTDYIGFNPSEVGYVALATISSDNNVWLLDQEDFSLKKYDVLTQNLLINTPVDLILETADYSVAFMREHNNTLILADPEQGVFVFDNIGNYQARLNLSGIQFMSFHEEDMCFIRDGYIVFRNLFSGGSKAIPLPAHNELRFRFPLVSGTHVVLFTDSTMEIFGRN